jgi:hypothetical protein
MLVMMKTTIAVKGGWERTNQLEELGEGLLVLEGQELADAVGVGGEELAQLPQRGLEALAIALAVQQSLQPEPT